MLAQLVKDGKLPPVVQRLPQNPRVVHVLEETGQYGGVWHRAHRGLTDYLNLGKLMETRLMKWDARDPNSLRVVPNVIEKWEQSKDATEFTFYLRKGLKWSDGVEMTTDDVTFWWEDSRARSTARCATSTPAPIPSLRRTMRRAITASSTGVPRARTRIS
jgi:peptide/nickel transport system substrate-binding protein